MAKSTFPSPYDIKAPKGAEDWREMYPYYLTFQEELREKEEGTFYFCNNQHFPIPLRPFDSLVLETTSKTLGQYNTRQWIVPPANGIDYRYVNGYAYLTMIPVPLEDIESRVPKFMERAGHYFGNWETLLENWHKKVKQEINNMEEVQFEPLPQETPLEWVQAGRGLDPSNDFMNNYDKMMSFLHRIWQYHFEFLNLGYAAYLDFFNFVKEQFPSVPEQGIAKMVQGIESVLFRPDEELKKLARLALDLDVADTLSAGDAEEALASVAATPGGREWLEAWETAKDPWFNYSTGSGILSSDKRWIDHLDIPLGFLRNYILKVQAGEVLIRPTGKLAAERDRITSEYRDMMDPEVQEVFDKKLALSRMVFPYVEDHNFYIEHWSMGVFWRKARQLSSVLQQAGFWEGEDGLFFVQRSELQDILFDYINSWASGFAPVGRHIWPEKVKKRRKMLEILGRERPVPALNNPPEIITEPFTVMLWGITSQSIERWANAGKMDHHLQGMAASPGVVEGVARVLSGPDRLDELDEGEILVCPVTAPSWAPVFGKISAVVTDIGGIMSHAAIVCREYGLPAVTGTGFGSARIKNGMRLRVNGDKGIVEVMDDAA